MTIMKWLYRNERTTMGWSSDNSARDHHVVSEYCGCYIHNEVYLMKKCPFDKSDGCHALACYSHRECGSRDEHGNPIYVEKVAKHGQG